MLRSSVSYGQEGMDRKVRREAAAAVVLMIGLLLLNGCAGLVEYDPERLLNQAVSGVIGQDDFIFEGKTRVEMSGGRLEQDLMFSGKVSGHHDIYIEPHDGGKTSVMQTVGDKLHYSKVNKQWTIEQGGVEKQLNPLYTLNPLIHIEHLNRSPKEVEILEATSPGGLTVLRAVAEEKELVADFKKQLREEHRMIVQAAMQEARAIGDEAMFAELEEYAKQAEQKLEKMLASLRIQADYVVKVEKRNRRLDALDYTANLQYELDGSPREETIRTSYVFPR